MKRALHAVCAHGNDRFWSLVTKLEAAYSGLSVSRVTGTGFPARWEARFLDPQTRLYVKAGRTPLVRRARTIGVLKRLVASAIARHPKLAFMRKACP